VKPKARTVGELRRSGYQPRSVRSEIRENLKRKLSQGEPLFPGIQGYDRTVIPGIVNALLAGHDILLLGLRGQAKTRILRQLVQFLDPEIPYLEGSELREDPLVPITTWAKRHLEETGEDAPVGWLPREARYQEKLATPDVTIADLLGDVDPIKAATRQLTFADPEVIHFGLIPRSHRGIFVINELPDLAARIQVGLLNLLEERDLQIRGFPIRLPLDILFAFSANPEDYTHRGSIITPLKDRIASQILTHYPQDLEVAARITEQEAWTDRDVPGVVVPKEVRLLIEDIVRGARQSELVDQSSGVSARASIAALELLVSNLERRVLRHKEKPVYPRVCDLPHLAPALLGKLELVYEGEEQGPELLVRKLLGQAVGRMFVSRFPALNTDHPSGVSPYTPILRWFEAGNSVTLSDEQPFQEYAAELSRVPGLMELANTTQPSTAEERAFWAEVVLEGLHQELRLARQDLDSTVSYREALKFQLLKPSRRGPHPAEPH
jgi:magnesium chelatase subunit I